MFEALYIGATGMHAHARQVDVIAHNLANVSTVGFRRQLVSFAELSGTSSSASMADAVRDTEGVAMPEPVRGIGSVASLTLSQLNGELRQTGESLDFAIDGTGLLEVIHADGSPAYTRAASLRVNPEGLLTTADGSVVTGRIEIPPDATSVRFTREGRVLALVGGDTEETELGQLELVRFPNPAGLEATGDNLYVATMESGEPRADRPGENGLGTLRQGYVESSNVQLVDELVALMLAQRAFEMNSRVLQAVDQLMAVTNGLLRA